MTAASRDRRLCMVVHSPYPDPRVAREARAAVAAGFAVDVFAMRSPGQPSREIIDGVRVRRLPFRRRRGSGAAGLLWEYLGFAIVASVSVGAAALRRRYAVVHVHNPPDFLLAAGLVPKACGAALVFDVHDLAPDLFGTRFGERPGAGAVDAALRLIERWAAGVADEVLTVHEPYRRELVQRGVPPRKLSVVMNSVDEALLEGLGSPEPEPAFRVAYHGAVTPPYGIEMIVEAVALAAPSVESIRLDIYGDGDSMSSVAELASSLGISERVRLGGYLPQREALARVRGASVGVIPNPRNRLNRFALSTKLFEYVLLGVPVVSADLPTIREHFSGDEVLYYEPGNPRSLASALLAVAGDPDGAARRARAARVRYGHYRWDANARRYVDVLERAAARCERRWRLVRGRAYGGLR